MPSAQSQYEGMSDETFKTMVEHDLEKIEERTDGAIHLIHSTVAGAVEDRKWHIKTTSTTRVLSNIEVVGFIDGVNEALAFENGGSARTAKPADYRESIVTFVWRHDDDEHEGEDDESVAMLALDLTFETLSDTSVGSLAKSNVEVRRPPAD